MVFPARFHQQMARPEAGMLPAVPQLPGQAGEPWSTPVSAAALLFL